MPESVTDKDSESDTKTPESGTFCIDFHGAAIIDENGNEIAITEEMVKQACQEIEKSKP